MENMENKVSTKPKFYMKLRSRNKKMKEINRDGEMIHFGGDKYLVRFGPYLHLFVAKNNCQIYRKGCVSNPLFYGTSLATLVKALKRKMFVENNSYCVGDIYLAPLSNCAKKIYLNEDYAEEDEDTGFEGYRITDTVVKGERIKRDWNPAVEHFIHTVNSSLVIIDGKGEAYYTNKKGYAVIDYLPSMCDTIIVCLTSNKKEIMVTTIEEYDSLSSCVKLGPAKGHLLMTSATSLDSAPFQVLFTSDEEISAAITAINSRKSSPNLIRPNLFCALNNCCLIQFGGKVYLLGNKVNDSKPVALIKLSANTRQSISILQINELIKQNCFEVCEQVFIGKQSQQKSDDSVMLKKLDTSAAIVAKDQSFLLDIAEIIETLLTVTNDELKPKTICFGDIIRSALIVHVNAEGKLTDFEYGCKQKKLQTFIECGKQWDESENKPRIELKAQMMMTDSKRDKRRYPLDISANKHTISLDRNATLYIRGSACNGVVKLERKGIAFVTGYLIIITDKGGTVCQPNQIKIIQIEAGHHLLQCGQNGHILFVGSGSFLVFNPFNVDEDPIISYFEKVTNNTRYQLYDEESDSEDDMSEC